MRRRVDQAWLVAAGDRVRRWTHLQAPERKRLLDQARLLERTRSWEGLDDLAVTPEMRALIAVDACVLTVGVGMGVFTDVTSILLAPTSSVRTTRRRLDGSIVTESPACLSGETLLHGPIRLAWDQVLAERRGDLRTSVVIHEFAHKIDMADGFAEGTPPIADRRQSIEFEHTTERVLESLRAGVPSRSLRPYAATNRSELFAVVTEAFFLEPTDLQREHPGLYRVLEGFYRQDPRATRQ